MNRKELDLLSAVVDNEVSHEVMVQVSHRICREEAVRQTLLRYQMIGDTLRGEEINPRSDDLVMAVSRRLESEPTVLAPPVQGSRHRWLQPVAGAAIAASVAAAGVILGPRFINKSDAPGGSVESFRVVAQPVGPVAQEAMPVSREEMRWKTVAGHSERSLDRYLQQHSHYATQNGLQSLIPYTTLVSYGGISRKQGE
jgi:negative regulator of sigma E activity